MKRLSGFIAGAMILFALLPMPVWATELLIPVGAVIGLQLGDNTVTVAAFDDSCSANAREAGLKIGDEIVTMNDTPVDSAEDVRTVLRSCDGTLTLTLRREGKLRQLQVSPQKTEDGHRLGVYLRQGITGIGTVTYYDPETGRFGTLGHGVSSPSGGLLKMTRGCCYQARVESVQKGKAGCPGQLKGAAESSAVFGQLIRNTPQGVFGITKQGWKGEPLPVGDFEDVHTGSATIRSTVGGTQTREYSVEILKIYAEDRSDGRNFLLRVTDPDLLGATGGIVQGMSGSPIIQDGKLIGAVTHVLVNSPETGYGIFIENMLEAAS